jgi:nucleoside-diphosphate-sugar epimerase
MVVRRSCRRGARRSFSWVRDVVGAMLALIAHPKAHGEVFNIGHTEENSIYNLAVLVKQMTGSASCLMSLPPGPHEVRPDQVGSTLLEHSIASDA